MLILKYKVKTKMPSTDIKKEHESPKLAPAEADNSFTEVLSGTSKNYDVTFPGIVQPEEIGISSLLESGEAVSITGMFDIGSPEDPRAVAIVTMHDPVSDSYRVTLGGLQISEAGELKLNNKWIPLDKDKGIVLGRHGDREADAVVGSESLWPGTGYFSSDVSSRHVSIFFDGRNINLLDTSMNGTRLYNTPQAAESNQQEDDFGHLSTHTMTAKEQAALNDLLRQNRESGQMEYSGSRPVIDRSTTDPEGMVDIRSWVGGSEAIVVDSKKEPRPYQELLRKCDSKLTESGVFTEKDVLQAVFETVAETISYDLEYANTTADEITTKSKKINLAVYIEEGKGVCRHMALACQWLGARLAEQYPALFDGGEFTVPVNQREKDNAAHEWVRYTNPKGKVYIIDVAQNFMGTLEDVVHDTTRGVERWEYFTDAEEKKRYEKFLLGDTAVRASSSFFRRKKR